MVSKSKRVIALLLTAMMASAALTGCGGGNEGSEDKKSTSGGDTDASAELSVYDMNDAGTIDTIKTAIADEAKANGGTVALELWCAGDDLELEKSLVKEFKKKYADDRYKFDIKINTAYGEDKAGQKIVENPQEGADVFNFADDQLSSLVQANAIAEISPLFQGNVVADNTDDSVKVCELGGKPYGFPKTSDNGFFLYYDKRIYKSEDDVKELDKMIETAAANKKNVFMSLGNGWYSAGFFFAADKDIFSYDAATKKQKANFNSDAGFAAAKAMCHVSKKDGNGFIGSPGTQGENVYVQAGFEDGSLAAAVIGTWMGPQIKKAIGTDNVGAAKMPTALIDGKQVQLHSFGGYKVVGVNAFSKYKVAAQTLAYYLTCSDSQLKRYKERGLIPTNKTSLEDKEVQADPARKAIEAQKEFAHAQGTSVSSKFWSSNVGGFGGQIVTKKGGFSDAELKQQLKDIQDQIEKD